MPPRRGRPRRNPPPKSGSGANPPPEHPVNPDIATAVQQFLSQMMSGYLAQLTEASRQSNGNPPPSAPPINQSPSSSNPPENIGTWLREFNKQKPRVFTSAANPIEAENWITHLEKIFRVMGCPDHIKVELATYKLEDDAHNWWYGWLQSNQSEQSANLISWARFKELFYQQYFTASDKDAYVREYASIRQGDDESISDFQTRFLRLARFAGVTVGTVAQQSDKFKWALNSKFKNQLLNLPFYSISELVDAGKNIERSRQEVLDKKADDNKKRGREFQSGRTDSKSFSKSRFSNDGKQSKSSSGMSPASGFSASSSQGSSGASFAVKSNRCDKWHRPGPCLRMTGSCYKCGRQGHLAKDCKSDQPEKSQGKEKLSTAGGRVFALSGEKSTAGMVSGILSLINKSVYVLFDTGAMFSVMSENLAEHLRKFESPIESPILITTPLGGSVCVLSEFKSCPLTIGDHIREVTLLPIKMKHFDIILGMDWLSKHQATIDCNSKKIFFGDKDRPEFIYQGTEPDPETTTISSLKVESFTLQSEGYLVSLQESREVPPKFENIPVVNEFPDVFLMNLPEFHRKEKLNLLSNLFRELVLFQKLLIEWLHLK